MAFFEIGHNKAYKRPSFYIPFDFIYLCCIWYLDKVPGRDDNHRNTLPEGSQRRGGHSRCVPVPHTRIQVFSINIHTNTKFPSITCRSKGNYFTQLDYETQSFGFHDFMLENQLINWTNNKKSPFHYTEVDSQWFGRCYTFKRGNLSGVKNVLSFNLKKNIDVSLLVHSPGK